MIVLLRGEEVYSPLIVRLYAHFFRSDPEFCAHQQMRVASLEFSCLLTIMLNITCMPGLHSTVDLKYWLVMHQELRESVESVTSGNCAGMLSHHESQSAICSGWIVT